VRFNIGAEDSGFFSENRKPGSDVRNVITEQPNSVSSQILPPKQAQVFGCPAECYISSELHSVFVIIFSYFSFFGAVR